MDLKIAENMVPTLLFLVPLGGATYTILKRLYKSILEMQKKRRLKISYMLDYLKPLGMSIVLIWGLAILLFMTLGIWFPSIEIPKNIRIVVIIMLVPYLIIIGALYGLSRAVAGGAGSVADILSDGADIISDVKNRNENNSNIGIKKDNCL